MFGSRSISIIAGLGAGLSLCVGAGCVTARPETSSSSSNSPNSGTQRQPEPPFESPEEVRYFVGSWQSTDTRDRETQLVISARQNGLVSIYYFSDGRTGSCEIEGEVSSAPDALRFSSWQPAGNRALNPLIEQRRSACTLEFARTAAGTIQVRKVSAGCAEACEDGGRLENELRRL